MGRTRVSGPVTHPAADHAGAGLERLGQHRRVVTMGPAASNVSPALTSPKGLDVSAYQPIINWSTVEENGAKFAYAKATEGTGYLSPAFAVQYNGSHKAGLIRGAYHFALPDRSSGAAQADYFVSNGGGWSADGKTLPGALDIEYNPYGAECYGKSRSGMVTWITHFVNEYQARTSRWPAIYSTTDWWKTCTGNSAAFGSTVPLWIACYCGSAGTLPAGWPTYKIWQYADSGIYPGDQDLFHGTFLGLERLAGTRTDPVALVGAAGTVRVYARETDRAAYQDALPAGGDWTGLKRFGGTWPANVAALVSSSGPIYAFAVGSGGRLYDDVLHGATWSGWKNIVSTTVALQGKPAVVQDHQGTIRVYVRGTNGSLYQTRLPAGGTWTGLSKTGGAFAYNAAAFAGSGGYVWVFGVRTDRVLYTRYLPPGGTWSAWAPVARGATGVPAVVQDHTGTLRVYVRGTDWALHAIRRPPGSGWSSVSSLGGRFPDSPAAIVAGTYVWAFGVGTGGVLNERHLLPGASWSAWARVTSGVTGVPAAVQDHSGTIRIFLRGSNSVLYQVRRPVGQGWSAIGNLGGPLF